MEAFISKDEVTNQPMAYGRFEMILDEAGAPIDAKALEVNPGFKKYFGLGLSELKQSTLFESFKAFYKGRKDSFLQKYYNVAYKGEDYVEIVHFDSTTSFEVSVYSPALGQFIMLFQNASNRQDNDLMYRDILNNIRDAVFITNAQGTIKFVSPSASKLFGITHDQVMSFGTIDRLIKFDVPIQLEELANHPNDGLPRGIGGSFASKHGGVIELMIDMNHLTNSSESFLIVCKEITEENKIKKQLADSNDYYEALLDTTSDAIYSIDKELFILNVNRAATELTNHSSGELIGMHLSQIDRGLDNFEDFEVIGEKSKLGTSHVFERNLTNKAGKEIHVEISARLVDLKNESIFITVVKNLTERDIQEIRFRKIVNQAPLGIALIADNSIPYMVNKSFCDMLEYSSEELCQMTFSEFTHPDDEQLGLDDYKQLLKGAINGFKYNKRYITKTGKTVFASLVVCSIEDEISATGRTTLAMVHDISDTVEKNELLKVAIVNLSKASQIARLGGWTLDLAKDDLVWSDEVYTIFGEEPQSFKSTMASFYSYIHPADVEVVRNHFNECLEMRKPYTIRHRIITKSGETKFVEENAVFEFDTDDTLNKIEGTVQDVTETIDYQNKLKADIQRLQRTLTVGELLAFEVSLETGEILLIGDERGNVSNILPLEYLANLNTFYSSVRANYRKRLERHIQKIGNGEIGEADYNFQAKVDEKYIWYQLSATLIDDRLDGNKNLFVLIKLIENEKNEEVIGLLAQDRERKRISRDIHDSIAQMLVGTRLMLKTQKVNQEYDLDDIDEMLGEMIKESRIIINNFGVNLSESDNLKLSFLELGDKMNRAYKGDIIINWHGGQHIQDLSLATHVFRIFQESLSNAIKYSEAKQIIINVRNYDCLFMDIIDYGVGFDLQCTSEGFGMENMKIRAHSIKARFWVESAQNVGTTVRLRRCI